MRPVYMWNLISLDGHFEGTTPWELSFHEFAWGEDLERLSIEQLDAADTLLFGRRTYEGMAAHWTTARGRIADRMNGIRKVVVSNTLPSADWSNSQLVRGDGADAAAALKAEAGKHILVFGSAILSDALTKRGLIDEYRICVAPVVLGAGRPLFPQDGERVPLRLLGTSTTSTGCTIMRYARAS